MSSRREQAKKEAKKKQKTREKMAESRGNERFDAEDMLVSMKAGFDNVTKQIGSSKEENRKEMKDIRESILSLGNMLREQLATFNPLKSSCRRRHENASSQSTRISSRSSALETDRCQL